MGMAAGEAIVTACNYAKNNNLPLIFSVHQVEQECRKVFYHLCKCLGQ